MRTNINELMNVDRDRIVTAPIDAVVVTHNSMAVLDALLDSMPAAMAGIPYRTAIVDCGSSDETVQHASARGDCVVIPSRNVGYAAGINRGVTALAGEGPILVLNPDVRLGPGSVRELAIGLAQPGTGITAPKVVEPDGTLSHSLRREPTLARALGLSRTGLPALAENFSSPADYARSHVVDWAVGAALLVSRDCYRRLSGWDESYFLYSEETDFCLRARDSGLATLYVPSAECCHIGGASGRSGRTHAMQVLNRVRLYRRRHGLTMSALYFASIVAAEVSRVLCGNPESLESLACLLSKRRRPAELGCSDRFLPR